MHHMDVEARDSNGAQLAEGDSVILINTMRAVCSSAM